MTKLKLELTCLTLLAFLTVGCGDGALEPIEDVEDPIVDVDAGEDFDAGEIDDALVAEFDNDSADNPAVDEFLSITGQRELEYTDAVSAEDGDNNDFVVFELPNNSNPNQRIEIDLDCDIFGDQEVTARVDLFNVKGNVETRINGGPFDCNGGPYDVTVKNDQKQLARIRIQGTPQEQTLIEYSFAVTPFR